MMPPYAKTVAVGLAGQVAGHEAELDDRPHSPSASTMS